MVKLRLGNAEHPLVLTVGALDELAQMGVTLENLFQYMQLEGRDFGEAIDHGLRIMDILLRGGESVAYYQNGTAPEPVSREILRHVLTPGQVWGLCEAAVLDSLKRTVEADHSKNADPAV